MKTTQLRYLIITCVLLTTVQHGISQNIYDNKLGDCDTSRFGLESKVEQAKIEDSKIIDAIKNSLNGKAFQKLRGVLKLQIIVYTDGSSCLFSYENETNLKASELDIDYIKTAVDTDLVWNKVEENVTALLEINFKKRKTVIRRMGIHGDLGWHILKK
ncbi:hypothetical protein LY01_01176 [Nonlabens xylanidelens]|uniref:Uncharacterized protein n=1 Tax=Nonlabens xylanidelens TaxID=191564 RepID=A0A2S6IN53_9FLAO|nr:hypothetical protein [Nonlabens xylanidelens]PPK95585.1 hypothetical protein LY01_01176 [Nonlabens xylanidelens]PQJ22390.1 hypothetical protein BST94_02125 [Nonlabens xylanidelens]